MSQKPTRHFFKRAETKATPEIAQPTPEIIEPTPVALDDSSSHQKQYTQVCLNYRFDDLHHPLRAVGKVADERRQLAFSMKLRLKAAAKIEKAALPESVDMRKYSPGIYDQGIIGSCVAHSICAAVQLRNNYVNGQQYSVTHWTVGKKKPVFKPSRLALYWHARMQEGSSSHEDSGSSMHAGLIAMENYKLCDEKYWPYETSQYTREPPMIAYTKANEYSNVKYTKVSQELDTIRYTLHKGYPIVFGIVAYPTIKSKQMIRDGKVPMPKKNEQYIGGHALLIVGYNDKDKTFTIQNSWGTGWGDNGFGYLPYEYVLSREHAADFWSVEDFS